MAVAIPELWSDAFWLACGIAAFGGFFRGFSGFGGVMAMTPLFVLLMPPPQAAVVAIFLDATGALPVLSGAVKQAKMRTAWLLAISATIFIVPGAWILTTVDPDIMRRVLSGMVALAALLLLSPWRYQGKQTTVADLAVGGVSGFLAGSTGMAGPPFILYLTALRESATTTRATFIVYSMLMTAGAFAIFVWFGTLTGEVVLFAVALAPVNATAVLVGQRLFRLINDEGFRRFTLLFLIILSLSVLVFG